MQIAASHIRQTVDTTVVAIVMYHVSTRPLTAHFRPRQLWHRCKQVHVRTVKCCQYFNSMHFCVHSATTQIQHSCCILCYSTAIISSILKCMKNYCASRQSTALYTSTTTQNRAHEHYIECTPQQPQVKKAFDTVVYCKYMLSVTHHVPAYIACSSDDAAIEAVDES
jgi:hypothetical protein